MSKNPVTADGSELRVALVHDELIRRGGAERVLEALLRMYPQADVYALFAGGNQQMTVNGRTYAIKTSFLQKLPSWFRKHPKRMLPLLSQAVEQWDFSQYDLVISSSSGFAKGIITRASVPHICYCHTPTRYLWDASHEVAQRTPRGTQWLGRMTQHYLRMADVAAAGRPDMYIANSEYTRRRLMQYYRRESTVVYPPINTTFFTPGGRREGAGERPFLVVGRLSASKRFDEAISVCERLQLPLVVVGTGPEYRRLQRMAGRYTSFAGKLSDEELRTQYREARALLQPGVEDFGMTAAEALCCGLPVVAWGVGGVKEIVRSGRHGYLYAEPGEESLAEGLRRFRELEKNGKIERGELQRAGMLFSWDRFAGGIEKAVEKSLREYHTGL